MTRHMFGTSVTVSMCGEEIRQPQDPNTDVCKNCTLEFLKIQVEANPGNRYWLQKLEDAERAIDA